MKSQGWGGDFLSTGLGRGQRGQEAGGDFLVEGTPGRLGAVMAWEGCLRASGDLVQGSQVGLGGGGEGAGVAAGSRTMWAGRA